MPRFAYLTASDPGDKRAWSGIHFSILHTLRRQGFDVTPLGPWQPEMQLRIGRMQSFLSRKLTGKRIGYSHSLKLAKTYGRYFSAKLKQKNYDAVIAVAASAELAFLETDLPVYYIADATFANMTGYYSFYSELTKRSLQEGHETQQRALKKAAKLFFPSEWAAQSAVNDYDIPLSKVNVLPFGANLDHLPQAEITVGDRCRLLFVGVEWERKGGPVALETLRELRRTGTDASLTIVGCSPNVNETGVTVIPFLDKNDPQQREQLTQLFAASDFLLLPTRAECYGIVFAEAAAYGLPSLTYDTGGVRGAVRENVNGFLFSETASGKDFAEKILALREDPHALLSLKKSARRLYETELNWNSWARRFAATILPASPAAQLQQAEQEAVQ